MRANIFLIKKILVYLSHIHTASGPSHRRGWFGDNGVLLFDCWRGFFDRESWNNFENVFNILETKKVKIFE